MRLSAKRGGDSDALGNKAGNSITAAHKKAANPKARSPE